MPYYGLAFTLLLCFSSTSTAAANSLQWNHLVEKHCRPLGIPSGLVHAIIDVESLGNPLALGLHGGEGHFPTKMYDAKTLLYLHIQATGNIGIGLMQINYLHHHDKISGVPDELFDPEFNIKYGCGYLAKLLSSKDPLWKKVGRYYAKTDESKQQDYAHRVFAKMGLY